MKSYERYFTKLYPVLSYILKIHLLALLSFFIIRLVFFIDNNPKIEDNDYGIISEAFLIGLHFDNLVASVITFFPLVAGLVVLLFQPFRSVWIKIINAYYIITYLLCFAVSTADIPYFSYFYKHLDVSAVNWMKYGSETFGMIYNESGYYKYFALFTIIALLFSFTAVYLGKKTKPDTVSDFGKITKKFAVVGITLLALTGYGLSRTYGSRFLNAQTAYFSENNFVNEVCHNAVSFLMRSITNPSYNEPDFSHIISDEEAFRLLKTDFGDVQYCDISPVCRYIENDSAEIKANVVVVLMESMSSYYIEETPHLTPYLNELKNRSYYFKNIFSPGTHTNQGIFSTLFGIPAIFDKLITDNRGLNRNNLINSHLPECEGLPYNLNKKGYTPLFFFAHSKEFDNMDVFLRKNGYESQNIYSKKDYPESEYVNYWGVGDKYLYYYAKEKLSEQTEPFFACIMTITNHPDYVVPQEFKHISKDLSEQAVYYSDYCIKVFLEETAQKQWFSNTVFVFVADHGKYLGNEHYEIPLNLNRIPMFIYSPLFEVGETIENVGSQIDIFPTVMGLLNMDYDNNSLGIDLLKEKRRYTVFTTDDKIGCIDENFMYNYGNYTLREALYDYKNNSQDISDTYPEVTDSMRNYAAATVQAANYLLNKRLTKRKE